MWEDKYISYWAAQWSEAMEHTDNFSAEIRTKDEVDQHAEQDVFSYDEAMGADCARVTKTLEMLRQRGFLMPAAEALDIGSGTGIFTLPLAQAYKRVTSLDISAGMQSVIRKKAAVRGLTNIDYISHNWKNVDVKEAGLQQRYGLVLSSLNTRGICSLETLEKMNQASKSACCLLAFTGGGRKNHGAALNQLVLGRQLESAGGNDIIMPFNLIYHMGGRPELSYSSVHWHRVLEPEAAAEGICFNYWRFAEITPEKAAQIKAYVYAHLEADGKYHEYAEVPVGIMVWDAQRIRERKGE